MTTRTLPPSEWHRLDDETRAFLATLDADDVAVVVVEKDGAIVARLGVMRIPHLESFWMAPEVAGNAGVTRALLRAAMDQALTWAKHWFYANAEGDAMTETLQRLGGEWMPIHTFLFTRQRTEMEGACLRQ